MSNAPKGSGGNVAGKTDGTIGAGKSFDVQDYPPTINFASSSDENKSLVAAGSASRRPGGSMRGTKWHTKCNAPSVNEPIMGKNGNPGKSKFTS
jgi:hypothetical protein